MSATDLEIVGEVWYWRGPAPFHFVTVPEPESDVVHDLAPMATYGWGVIPVTARIGRTTWTTSLFPREGLYAVPIKVAVRRAEEIELGDRVTVAMRIETR